MKKAILSIACGLFTVIAMAEGRNDVTAEPSKSEGQAKLNTYFVTGEINIAGQLHYNVSESDRGCNETDQDKPCEVLSSQAKDSNNRIPASAVQQVVTTQEDYN